MLTWLTERGRVQRTATELYGLIVTQSREPAFYLVSGVADTIDGRYGLLVLHMWLTLGRLRDEGPAAAGVAQALLEAFIADMDDNMREIGVGDLSVPRKVKKAAAGLYDRGRAYDAALAEGDGDALARSIALHMDAPPGWPGGADLAAYVHRARARLAATPVSAVLAGQLTFPPPVLTDSP
jgi:cytochrome b pre-mRNA-processing protein 3